jgi:CDP-glycerol glycerophosphotransferase (TagB/SpsB family)
MKAIIINRQVSTKEEKLISKLIADEPHQIIKGVSFGHLKKELSSHLISFDLSPEEKKSINYNTLDSTLLFGEKKIGETSISDYLQLENFKIWYYFKFRIYFILRNTFYEIRQIQKVLTQYDEVIYYGSNNLILQYPFLKPVEIRTPKKHKKINVLTLAQFSTGFLIRSLIGFLQINKRSKHKHIIIDNGLRQPVINYKTMKIKRGNYNLEYLYSRMGKDFLRLINLDFPKLNEPFKRKLKFKEHFILNKGRFFGDTIIFKGLFNKNVRKEIKLFNKNFKQQIHHLHKACNTPEEKIIYQQLKSMRQSALLFYFKYLSYKYFFQLSNFKTVSTIDENSPTNKAILDAAKTTGMKTIGIQHGSIHNLHAAYLFTKNDLSRGIQCDTTLVWGSQWKTFLEKTGNYPPESIKITGQIRSDIIPRLIKNKDKLRCHLPKELQQKKIVMFASQPQRDPKLRRRVAYDTFSAVKNMKDVILALKLHPNENQDQNYYKKIAQEAGCKNYTILTQVDLYILLTFSRVVITSFSTVGTEAIYFNKPLIIWDPLRQDLQHYHQEGVAFSVSNQNELRDCVINILDKKISIKAENQNRYISKYAYKIDGKAVDRTLQSITS